MNYAAESLEQQTEALAYLRRAFSDPVKYRGMGVSPQERNQWRTDMHSLELAESFFWNSRTVQLVKQSLDDFNLDEITCSRHVLFNDVSWHWFSDEVPFEIEEYKTKRMLPVRAITWYYFQSLHKPYLGATAWCQNQIDATTGRFLGPVSPTIWACVFKGNPLSSQIEEPELSWQGYVDERTLWETTQLKKFAVAASTFLRQKFLRVEKEPLERHARKRIQRSGGKISDISVVHLRKTPAKPKNEVEAEAQKIDWQWQWSVKKHVRQQWYATLQEHLPIIIHPYLKGPEDKPLKPRTTPIFLVAR